MSKFIQNIENENHFRLYAPIFRIFIGLYLLRKAFFSWEFQEALIHGSYLSGANTSPILKFLRIDAGWFTSNFEFFYGIYVLLIIFFLFGIGKNITTLFLLIFLQILSDYNWIILNGGDNLLEFVLLYLVFIDSFARFSIKPLRFKRESFIKSSNFLSNLGGISICMHLCVVYFISALYKIHSDDWFHGIGIYYSLATDRFHGTSFNFSLIQSSFFVVLATYATMAIELAFPFLIWFRKTRYVMIALAVLLHLGIALFTMLYSFQLLFVFLQGFFIRNHEWKQIFGFVHKHLDAYKSRT